MEPWSHVTSLGAPGFEALLSGSWEAAKSYASWVVQWLCPIVGRIQVLGTKGFFAPSVVGEGIKKVLLLRRINFRDSCKKGPHSSGGTISWYTNDFNLASSCANQILARILITSYVMSFWHAGKTIGIGGKKGHVISPGQQPDTPNNKRIDHFLGKAIHEWVLNTYAMIIGCTTHHIIHRSILTSTKLAIDLAAPCTAAISRTWHVDYKWPRASPTIFGRSHELTLRIMVDPGYQ